MTPQQIQEVKAKYGGLYKLTAQEEGEQDVTIYVRPMDMKVLSGMTQIAKKDEVEAGAYAIRKLCVCGNADQHKDNPKVMLAFIQQLEALVKPATATLEKL